MSDMDFEQTYLVTYRVDDQLAKVSTVRSITLAATTTDIDDARVLTLSDLVEEFGVEVAAHFVFVDATVKV
ncbi:MAG: hypothetical protein JW384_04182 [Nitrosomonadaceae bacterium]|nr:hypothetical protein [Nitrosomonadaceae bacterium]